MKSYRELSRRGRLYRIRRVAEQALDAYGLKSAQLNFVQYTANIIYRVDLPGSFAMPSDGSANLPNRYVLRVHAMDDVEAIASELTWLAALSLEAGLKVPAPVPAPDGKLLVTILTKGVAQGRIVSLLRWLDGRRLSHSLCPKHLTALGHAVARMHVFSAGWQSPAGFTRPAWNWDSQLGGSLFKCSRQELVDSMPPHAREPFETVSREAQRVMQSLGQGPDAYGMIHADLYPENVLFRAGEAYPIDFEDCGYGYWMWDIAVALCQWAWGEDWERMRDAFREGYARVRTLPESQWGQLDLFVATQFATMVLWASAFLKDDPMRSAEHIPWRNDNINKLLSWPSL